MAKKLKDLLSQARKLKGVSLREVETHTGISNGYLYQLENGTVKEPSPHKLFKLADYFGIPYAVLMEGAGYIAPGEVPASSDTMLMGMKLTDDELNAVAGFVRYLRQNSSKKSAR